MFTKRRLMFLMLAKLSLVSQPVFAGEKVDAIAKDTVEQFEKARITKDADGLMKVVDVPFWINGILKERDELKKELQKLLRDQDFSKDKLRIKMVAPLSKLEESLGKKLRGRELWPEKDHRMVLVEIERGERKLRAAYVVRIQDAKGKVVGVLNAPELSNVFDRPGR